MLYWDKKIPFFVDSYFFYVISFNTVKATMRVEQSTLLSPGSGSPVPPYLSAGPAIMDLQQHGAGVDSLRKLGEARLSAGRGVTTAPTAGQRWQQSRIRVRLQWADCCRQ